MYLGLNSYLYSLYSLEFILFYLIRPSCILPTLYISLSKYYNFDSIFEDSRFCLANDFIFNSISFNILETGVSCCSLILYCYIYISTFYILYFINVFCSVHYWQQLIMLVFWKCSKLILFFFNIDSISSILS